MAARLPEIGTFTGHPMLGVTLPPPPPPPLPPPPPPPPPPPHSTSSVVLDGCAQPEYNVQYRSSFPSVIQRDPFVVSHSTKSHQLSKKEIGNSRSLPPLAGFKRPVQTECVNTPKKLKTEGEEEENDTKSSIPATDESSPNSSDSSPKGKPTSGDALQQIKDLSLPKELTKLFGALKCDLCSVTVNSTIQARMHYIGKQHEKKVNAFLIKWCKETGQPMPNLNFGPPKSKKPANPDDLFCKVCNIALTSLQHAQQHYMGRNHLRVLNGHTPLKPGYFNKDTGKWQRLPQFERTDTTGRFGIGIAFLPESACTINDTEASTSTINVLETKSQVKNRRFFCELCQVATTSQDQLDMHLKGAKHRKAERLASSSGSSMQIVQTSIPLPSTPSDSILASVMRTSKIDKNKSGIKDYSIYRTPSGQFYCQPCNLTLNSESQFSQHCESRKHKLAMLKKPTNKGTGRGNVNLK